MTLTCRACRACRRGLAASDMKGQLLRWRRLLALRKATLSIKRRFARWAEIVELPVRFTGRCCDGVRRSSANAGLAAPHDNRRAALQRRSPEMPARTRIIADASPSRRPLRRSAHELCLRFMMPMSAADCRRRRPAAYTPSPPPVAYSADFSDIGAAAIIAEFRRAATTGEGDTFYA